LADEVVVVVLPRQIAVIFMPPNGYLATRVVPLIVDATKSG
jgi:hypothetical protein